MRVSLVSSARSLARALLPPLALAFALGTLTACMPALNWREASPEKSGFVVLMPAKPDRLNRPIDLNGLKVTMNMLGSKVDGVAYTVAWVDTPSPEAAQKAVEAMRLGMLRNLGQPDVPGVAAKVSIRASSASGNTEHWPAQQVAIKHGPQHMQALFLHRGLRAWQVVSLGPKLELEASKVFAESFQLLAE
jgi:hypothetical protein